MHRKIIAIWLVEHSCPGKLGGLPFLPLKPPQKISKYLWALLIYWSMSIRWGIGNFLLFTALYAKMSLNLTKMKCLTLLPLYAVDIALVNSCLAMTLYIYNYLMDGADIGQWQKLYKQLQSILEYLKMTCWWILPTELHTFYTSSLGEQTPNSSFLFYDSNLNLFEISVVLTERTIKSVRQQNIPNASWLDQFDIPLQKG